MNKELLKDKNWLTEQYWGFDLSLREMINLLEMNIYEATVKYWMEKNNIPRREAKRNNKEGMERLHDKNWLTEQYWGFDLSHQKMADILGCTQSNVTVAMQEFNIPTRDVILQPYHFPDWLIEQYYDKNVSSHNNRKLSFWMKQYNIPVGKNYLDSSYRDEKGRKLCYICKQWLDEKSFNNDKRKQDGLHQGCRKCRSIESLATSETDKIIAYQIYSDGHMKCALCNEKRIDCLTIDHIKGGGRNHRKKEKIKGQFVRWLRQNDYPDGFRILCWNCQHKERMKFVDEKNKPDLKNKEQIRCLDKRWKYRVMALQFYSDGYMKCELCGEDDIDCLTIDHIDGGGKQHRMKDKNATNLSSWVSSNNYPEGYRILCWNCNHEKCLSKTN